VTGFFLRWGIPITFALVLATLAIVIALVFQVRDIQDDQHLLTCQSRELRLDNPAQTAYERAQLDQTINTLDVCDDVGVGNKLGGVK